MLHHDNASSHTAGLTVEFLKQKQVKVVEYPPHSPDLAVSVERLANLRPHLARDEDFDWLDAQRSTLTALV
ncbi:hypothetical protein TNCV_861291 [Trichonephila clavipes]|nr:hypothetical protein TNCV_861291 [Trichonephila clavipes]